MASKMYRVLIMGAPASGKGTLASRIVKKFEFQHVSSGDILRWNIQNETEAGIKADSFVQSGQLVPDNVVIDCVLSKIKLESVPTPRILFDGFPRTQNQAVELGKVLPLDVVLHLIVPYEIIIERTKSRWIHMPSGRTYNIGFNDPKNAGKDDVTGEELVQRPDDKPDVVAARLKHYDELTKPIVEFYKKQDIVVDIFGKTSAEIWPHIDRFLSKALNHDDNKTKQTA